MKTCRVLAVPCLLGLLFAASAVPAQEQTMVMAMIATPKGFDPDIWVPGQIEAAVNLHEGLTRYGVRIGANGKSEIDPAKKSPNTTGPTVNQPMKTEGIASAMSGSVTTHGLSCRCSRVCSSMRSRPWNVMNTRRKL